MQESITPATYHKQCTIAYKFKCCPGFGYGSYFFIMEPQIVVANGVAHPCSPRGGRHSNIVLCYIYGVVMNIFDDPVYSRSVKMNKCNRHPFEISFDRAVPFLQRQKITLLGEGRKGKEKACR